ncbi:hypothetical protein DEU38_10478 [Rhodococcus sp. AG1013]|nr:hypothetical protein DEU38_10478 [Rhodococcus sp. AG1013]
MSGRPLYSFAASATGCTESVCRRLASVVAEESAIAGVRSAGEDARSRLVAPQKLR